jgi:hypothetical protein
MPIARRAAGRLPIGRIALGTAGGLLAVLGLAQLLLPGLAAQRVRSELGRYGTVRSASVSAFPAIELLWGSADSASVSAGSLRIGFDQAADELWRARGFERIDLHAKSLLLGPVALSDARILKRGPALEFQGSVRRSALRTVLPGDFEVQPESSAGGEVRLRASGSLLGVPTSVQALLAPQDGKLVAQPLGLPFAGLARVTIFSDPHVAVQGVALTPEAAGAAGDPVYLVRLWATLL